ncbi:F0F1 ATP synthase subunit B [Amycolatopsis cynarae]|uniref:ATP synthase subunit b n=2 Tax=Amycolatopsis TaxID=1813 RepID=A0A558D9L5_9PSEU|nr:MULTISPECIES: F0F1 ATP synthase subunit B [Amycolatopsis]TVT57663.1 F0F1 ATP synthase subunit B [Amycolatopsis rhizosphaerae]WAL64481.1 F0F1 ATP synthase subunit B [Amycolatopsis sp. HUAS 11-8]
MVKTQLVLAAESAPPNPVLPNIPEIIVGLVAFLILVWLLKKFAVPRFEKLYEERTAAIEGGIDKAEKAQAEAEEALAKYKAQLADAYAEAAKIRDDARLEAERIKEELRAEAQDEAARIIAQGHAALQAQKAQIVAELRAELGRNSIELASRIVGESLEDDVRRRGTVDRFLAELGTGNGAGN